MQTKFKFEELLQTHFSIIFDHIKQEVQEQLKDSHNFTFLNAFATLLSTY
jgi:hypothetical protein